MEYFFPSEYWMDSDWSYQNRLLPKIFSGMGCPPATFRAFQRTHAENSGFQQFNIEYEGFPLALDAVRLKKKIVGPSIFASIEEQEYWRTYCDLGFCYPDRHRGLIFGASAKRNGLHVPCLVLHNRPDLVNKDRPVTRIPAMDGSKSPSFIQHFDFVFGKAAPLSRYFPPT